MKEDLLKLKSEIAQYTAKNKKDIENFRLQFINKKGKLASAIEYLKSAPLEKKKEVGKLINEIKEIARQRIIDISYKINVQSDITPHEDLTLPCKVTLGARHPLSMVAQELINIFKRIGFNLTDGPEIEDDWHNFTALNIPENHPAREMQDTFFLKKGIVLRTQTSSVQIRKMENSEPPIRTISIGRVYRNEAISARSHSIFHQIEALYIDENINFKDLKQNIYYFVRQLFGPKIKFRLRPSHFPFTEPSAEVDVSCIICHQKGCKVCKYTGWVEIGGTGMVDPNVLNNCEIDKKKYSGFAFGMGIERIAMLKYKIDDLRLFTENNLKFLNQFI